MGFPKAADRFSSHIELMSVGGTSHLHDLVCHWNGEYAINQSQRAPTGLLGALINFITRAADSYVN